MLVKIGDKVGADDIIVKDSIYNISCFLYLYIV